MKTLRLLFAIVVMLSVSACGGEAVGPEPAKEVDCTFTDVTVAWEAFAGDRPLGIGSLKFREALGYECVWEDELLLAEVFGKSTFLFQSLAYYVCTKEVTVDCSELVDSSAGFVALPDSRDFLMKVAGGLAG